MPRKSIPLSLRSDLPDRGWRFNLALNGLFFCIMALSLISLSACSAGSPLEANSSAPLTNPQTEAITAPTETVQTEAPNQAATLAALPTLAVQRNEIPSNPESGCYPPSTST